MKHTEAIERIEEIQKLVERTTMYSLLPGIAALWGGLIAITGCMISWMVLKSVDFADILKLSLFQQVAFILMWVILCTAAIGIDVIYTAREAKRKGIDLIGRPGKLAGFSLTPCLIIALILSYKILADVEISISAQAIRYIAPIWMMCYGAGVYTAGLLSLNLPRYLGLAFILSGALSLLFWESHGVLSVAFSFGLLHLIFGALVIAKSRQGA